jgi:2Fe-2S ferredoxin
VQILEGESNVLPPSKAELSLIGTSYYLDQRRLACQMICFGPVKVDIKDHLEKSDSSNKKLRGFKSQSHAAQGPTQAKTGTLMLEDEKK